MRLTGLLRAPPSLRAVEARLLAELHEQLRAEGAMPSFWSVLLSRRDHRRRRRELPGWSDLLGARLLEEQRRQSLPVSGLAAVSFRVAPELVPGRFRVAVAAGPDPAAGVSARPPAPGHPRLAVAAGGSARHGRLAPPAAPLEVPLPLGAFVIGRDRTADLRLLDPSVSPRHASVEVGPVRARLLDLGSLNGTRVDGAPTRSVELVDGNRIEIGPATLVFHRDP